MIPTLQSHDVVHAGIFGSFARGEERKETWRFPSLGSQQGFWESGGKLQSENRDATQL